MKTPSKESATSALKAAIDDETMIGLEAIYAMPLGMKVQRIGQPAVRAAWLQE